MKRICPVCKAVNIKTPDTILLCNHVVDFKNNLFRTDELVTIRGNRFNHYDYKLYQKVCPACNKQGYTFIVVPHSKNEERNLYFCSYPCYEHWLLNTSQRVLNNYPGNNKIKKQLKEAKRMEL